MRTDPMELAFLAIPAAGLLVLFVRSGGAEFTGFGSLTTMASALGVAVVVLTAARLVGAIRRGPVAGRMVHGHAHGGTRVLAARHEAGHAAAALALGGRVVSAKLDKGSDPGGVVRARIPDTPEAHVTFLLAGQVAAGTRRGAGYDDAEIRRTLRRLPRAEANAVRKVATASARRIVRTHSDQINRDTTTLTESGRL